MKQGVLKALFGIGRTKDKAEFKLSQVVMDGVKKVHTSDKAGIEKLVADAMEHITPLSDSENREILIGAVTDSFSHPVETVAKEAEVGAFIDKLYSQCRDADEEALKKTLDGMGKEEEVAEELEGDAKEHLTQAEKLEGKKKEETKTKDTGKIVEEAVAKALEEGLKRVTDSIPAQVEAAVNKALGIVSGGKQVEKPKKEGDTRTLDSASDVVGEDAAFLLNGVFGGK